MNFLKCVAYLALIGVLAHFIGEALPRQWFSANRFPWRSFSWENGGKIYLKLHIRAWKDKLPDMSRFMPDMLPKRLSDQATAQELECLVKETCVAEATHDALSVCGFACVLLWDGIGGWMVSLLFGLGNLPFTIIQRYNRPQMVRLQNRLALRERNSAAELLQVTQIEE